jgi:hypothetical protein
MTMVINTELSLIRQKIANLKTRVQDAEKEMKELEESARSPFGRDIYTDGDILTWDQTWTSTGPKRFQYVALKANGLWWLTGTNHYNGITWDHFIRAMTVGRSYNVCKVSDLVPVR